MLERWVASIFSSYLGRYVKNLDQHGLQVSMWSGELVLNDLELSPEALDELDLPVIIDKGVIGKLRIEIPWKQFYSKTCKIEVSDVKLVVLPIKATDWDATYEEKKAQMRKQAQIRLFESSRATSHEKQQQQQQTSENVQDEKADGFGERLTKHILSTLQISIKKVLLRYEDSCTDPRRPVGYTLRLDELSAVPCDRDWNSSDVPLDTQMKHHRLCALRGLVMAIDHLPVAPRLTGLSKIVNHDKWISIMNDYAMVSGQVCTPEPLNLELKVTAQASKILDLTLPKTMVDATFKCVNLRLRRWQYDAINRTIRYVSDFSTLEKFRQFRPSAPVKAAPAKWWTFAYKCIQLVRREKRARTSLNWESIITRSTFKQQYITLFKRTLGVSWHKSIQPKSPDAQKFADLEAKLDFKDIIYFRRLAYFQLKIERQQHESKEDSEAVVASGNKSGWWQWLTWQQPTEEEEKDADTNEVWKLLDTDKWTPDQKTMLYEELGITDQSEAIEEQQDVPATYIQTKIQLTIWKGLIEMCENSVPPSSASDLLKCFNIRLSDYRTTDGKTLDDCIENISASEMLSQQPSNMPYEIIDIINRYKNTFGLTVTTAVAPSNTFAAIQLTELTTRWLDMHKNWKIMAALKDVDLSSAEVADSQFTSLIQRTGVSSSQLLLANIASNASTNALNAEIHLRPLTAVVDVTWLQTVCAFWGVGVYGRCDELEGQARPTTKKASVSMDPIVALKMALESNPTMTVSLVMEQPCLVVPTDCSDIDSATLVVAAESLNFASKPRPEMMRVPGSPTSSSAAFPTDEIDEHDFYNRYLISSLDGRVISTTVREWKAHELQPEEEFGCPVITDCAIDFEVATSLIPNIQSIPRVLLSGDLPNLIITLTRRNMLTTVLAVDNILEFASNLTGRGSENIHRAEDQDESGDSCSTLANVLGPMSESEMTMDSLPVKRYCELDYNSGQLILYNPKRSSKIDVVIDLSSGDFDIHEPPNALCILLGNNRSLWVQLPTGSMHTRWLTGLQRLQGSLGVSAKIPSFLLDNEETEQTAEPDNQLWMKPEIRFGDFKIVVDNTSEWVFSGCALTGEITSHDSKIELTSASLSVATADSNQPFLFTSDNGIDSTTDCSDTGSNHTESLTSNDIIIPGFSFWWLSMMRSSSYVDSTDPNQALMQMGIYTKGLTLSITPAMAESFELLWDIMNISMLMKAQTLYYKAELNKAKEDEEHVYPAELPKPYLEKQGIRFVVEIEGELELNCYRPNGELPVKIGGEDFQMSFHDTAYGISLDGLVKKPTIEDCITTSKWSRFMSSPDDKAKISFSYSNFQNYGALKSDPRRSRPTHFGGVSFTHQLLMSISDVEIIYFQTFVWSLLETFKTGTFTRLSFLSWRSVYDGEKVISPWDSYDPAQPPTEPYLDYLKIQMECHNCDIVMPPNRSADSGIFKGRLTSMGISNDFHKTDSAVLLCTKISMNGITLDVPEEFLGEVPKGSLFTCPVSVVLDTWGAVIDPEQQHPKSKLCLSIPREATFMFSDNVYCSLLTWMTQSLMEPYTPHFPVTPQGPLPFEQLVKEWRYNHFSWVLDFANLNIIWLNNKSIPEYTMETSMSVSLRWFENLDFENDIDITKFKITAGVSKGLNFVDFKTGKEKKSNTVIDLLGIMKMAIVWRTAPPPSKLPRKQSLYYNISGDGIFIRLDQAVILNVVDGLLSARAARSGGLKLIGWVEPEDGWPTPGDPWPEPPPQEHVMHHIMNISSIKVEIPDVCSLAILGTDLKYCTEPNMAAKDDKTAAATRTQIELNTSRITMDDVSGTNVIDTKQGENHSEKALAISAEQREDGTGWKSVAGRVGEISVVATVPCFAAIHNWVVGVEFKMLSHTWEATPEIRRSKVRELSKPCASQEVCDSKDQNTNNKLNLPEFDLSWTKPKLVILCTSKTNQGRYESGKPKVHFERERGFIIDFGEMRLVTSIDNDTEIVTATLIEAAIKSMYRDEYALRPTKITAVLRRHNISTGTDSIKEKKSITVEGDGIESFFDFSDMRAIAAVVYNYSNTLSIVRSSKPAVESSEPPTQPQVRLQNITQTMQTNSKNNPIPQDDEAINVLSISLSLPVISISLKSGLKPGELPTPDGLPLPVLEEPVLNSTVSISGIGIGYNQYSNGAAKLECSISRLGIDTPAQGPILEFENPKMTYHQISASQEEATGDQLINVDLGDVTIVIMPRVLFDMTTFVYLPYAAATMPDTFAAPDVMEIDEDWELECDTVFCRSKQIRVTNNHQNMVVLNGNLHELHLIGDRPLIKLDAGVTLLILGTKLYLYNKQLSDFVDADDGAYVYVPEDRNEIEPGFPAITNWTQQRKVKVNSGFPSRTSVSAKLSLCVVLPEAQFNEGSNTPKRNGTSHSVRLLTSGGGQYSYTVVDDTVTKEDAEFSMKGFTVKPHTKSDQPDEVSTDNEQDRAHYIVEPIEEISATLHNYEYLLTLSDIYVRISSADVGLILRCVGSLQTELNYINQQARLKINADDEDIIHEAIVAAQNQLSTTSGNQQLKKKKTAIGVKTIDVLIVEDSSGFDIPLFFIQLLDTAATAEDVQDYQMVTVEKLMLKMDFYNLEQCEWESVLDNAITLDLKYYVSGTYKRDLAVNISKISAFVTPQLMKTIDDAKRFGEAFSTIKVPAAKAHKSTQFRMYELRNETGYSINIELHGDRKPLPNLGVIDFNFSKSYGKKGVSHTMMASIPEVSMEEIEIDIGKVGTTSLVIQANGTSRKIRLYCTVRLTETGRKKVALRSSVTVHNQTNVRLQVTASRQDEMIAEPEGSVSIPHSSLLESYFKITPIDLAKDVRYSSAQLGLTYGSFHKLHKALYVVTSSPLVQKTEDYQPDQELHDFTCNIEITTDPVVRNTTITVLPIFTLLNLTGLKMSYTLLSWDGKKKREEKGRFKLFSKSKKCEYDVVAKGKLETDEEAKFTSAVAFHSMYLDIEITQPTGEVLKRNITKYPDPFLIRCPSKGHQGRVTSLALSDNKGRACHMSLDYSIRSVAVFCPLWIINQTSINIEIAVHNPMKISEAYSSSALTAGQVLGEGISPGKLPFLMAPPDLPGKEQIGHLYCKILGSPGNHGNPQWSSKIDTSKVGTTGTFECHERIGILPKTAAFSIEFPWGKVSTRTKVIRFTPRWVVFNRTPKTVFVRHRLGRDVPPGQPIPKSEFLVAPNDMYGEYEGGSTKNRMGVKIEGEEQAQFSKPFLIDQMGDTDINLKYKISKNTASKLQEQRRARKVSMAPSTKTVDIFGEESQSDLERSSGSTDEFDVVRVAIFKRGSTTYVTLDSLSKPPYIIENRTPIPITVKQHLSEKNIPILTFPAKRTKAFTWESQIGPKVAYIFVGSDSEAMVVNVDPKNKKSREETMQESKTPMGMVYLRVRHRAGTTKISITMDRQIDNWFNDSPFAITYTLNVSGVGVILQNDGVELSHLSFTSIHLQRKREQRKVTYIAKVGTLQLDDQREKTDFPVVLCNKIPRDRAPVLHLRVERTVERSSAAIHIENGYLRFQPLDIKLHDRFLFELLQFSRTTQEKVSMTTRTRGSTYYAFAIDTSLQSATADQDGIGIRPLYLENFKIDTINVNATLTRTAQHYSEDFFKQVLGYLSVFVGSFKDMALEWQSVPIAGLCDKGWLVASMLKDRYISETTTQLLRVAPGVASVTTFVTDLLSTLPIKTVSDNAIQFSTPRTRIRPIQITPAAVDITSPASIPLAPSPVIGRTPSNIFSTSGSSMGDEISSPPILPMSSADLAVSCIKINEASNHFGHGVEEELLFHEVAQAPAMTKRRAQYVEALKKKNWDKFHPSRGFTTWEEYAQTCTWEEFRKHTTDQEFKQYVHLAFDEYIRAYLADENNAKRTTAELCRCEKIEKVKGYCPGGLPSPSSAEGIENNISWYEFAHHTTWDEFRSKITTKEFKENVNFARDCHLGVTQGFQKLDKKQIETVFNS